jgi:hypothetical protein
MVVLPTLIATGWKLLSHSDLNLKRADVQLISRLQVGGCFRITSLT